MIRCQSALRSSGKSVVSVSRIRYMPAPVSRSVSRSSEIRQCIAWSSFSTVYAGTVSRMSFLSPLCIVGSTADIHAPQHSAHLVPPRRRGGLRYLQSPRSPCRPPLTSLYRRVDGRHDVPTESDTSCYRRGDGQRVPVRRRQASAPPVGDDARERDAGL